MMTGQDEILQHLRKIRLSAGILRRLSAAQKNQVLEQIAQSILNNIPFLLEANARDLAALPDSTTSAFRDRLTLNKPRLEQMVESLRQVAALPDPVGEVVSQRTLPNGLSLKKVAAPLGVIFMIFESRPNVITEAFSLGFKSGNAMILRGGRESAHSAQALYSLISQALSASGVDANMLWGITDSNRELVHFLLKQKKHIDVVVPRGGDGLIEYVSNESLIPIIKNDRGMCHVYIHEDADQAMAVNIVVNAKTQRPGVCNSLETVLVHEKVAQTVLPKLYDALSSHGVEWFGCPQTLAILQNKPHVNAATPTSFDTEYLDFKINARVVSSLEVALMHIEQHGSRHSESILTATEQVAREFQECVDAAAVYWNASTRFTDGFEFGLGGELGISTQKLHVRGPVGLRELTSQRWVIDGVGQIRN